MIVMQTLSRSEAIDAISEHTSHGIACGLVNHAEAHGSVKTNKAHGDLTIKATLINGEVRFIVR